MKTSESNQLGRTFTPPTLFFHGAGIEFSVMNFGKGSYTVMQVVLKPHAVKALFGISALQLKSGALEPNEFSRKNINERLLNAHSDQERVALLEKERTRDGLVEESLRLIHKSVGMINVKTLLDHLHISERHFERRFSEAVGISPLSYIRVRRFNEALRLIKTGQYNLYNV